MTGLKQYLFDTGAIEKGPEAIKEAELEFKRKYMREYLPRYRKSRMRMEILFTKAEQQKLESSASEHHAKVTPAFIKKCTFAYLDNTYLLHDPEQLHSLEVGIRRIGNHINQIAKRLNTGNFDVFDADSVHMKINEL